MRACFAVLAVVCLAVVSTATASDDTIRARARAGFAAFQHDEAALSAASERMHGGGRKAARDLIAAASTLEADMRIARASVFAELPTTSRGRVARSLLTQGFVALTAYAAAQMQYGRAVIDGETAGTREVLAGESAARLTEGTRLVHRGLALVS